MTPNSYAPMTVWLEHAWLTRYLDGLLSEEETAWFEAYALDKPRLLTAIEADTQLRNALSAEPPANEPSVPQAARAKRNYVARPPWLALAASAIVGMGVAWIGMSLRTQTVPSAELVANPTRIMYDTMRGGSTQRLVEPGDDTSPFLILQVTVAYGAADIHLLIDDDAPLALAAAKDGIATVLIQRRMLGHARHAVIEYKIDGSVQRQTLDLPEGSNSPDAENR